MSRYNRTHGMTGTKEYMCWINIKHRCLNPKSPVYSDYGGRGIKICPEWQHNFAAFYAHIGKAPDPRSQIDRINNEGNYEPGNVRWATAKQNRRNTRHTRLVTYKGKTASLTEICEDANIPFNRVYSRLSGGRTLEESLTMPYHPPPLRRPRGPILYIEYKGEKFSLSQISLYRGWHRDTIAQRLRRGWDKDRALTEPV